MNTMALLQEEKKAISKAKYDAEMAKNRAGAALLKAERDETMKEMALEGSEDEKNLEGLVAQDEGDDRKDSKNSRRPGISPGTGMTGATGVAAFALSTKLISVTVLNVLIGLRNKIGDIINTAQI